MSLEISGRLLHKLPVFTGTSARGNWSKQEFVLDTQDGQYPRKVCCSVFGDDKIRELDAFKEGDQLKVSINLESREYNGRWFTEAKAWRITKDGNDGVPATPAASSAIPPMPTPPPLSVEDDSSDDLPF